MIRRAPLFFVAFTLACAGSPEPAPTPPPATPPPTAAVAIEQQGPGKLELPEGGSVEVPAGLVAKLEGRVATLVEPEGKVEIKLVLVDDADLAAAIQAAWSAVDKSFTSKAEETIEPPPRDGWEAVRVESYAAPSPGGPVAQAIAKKGGGHTWVALLRGLPPELDKRAAQARSFFSSLKVAGVGEEDLSAQAPAPLGARKAELDAFIEAAMAKNGTPGLQIAVVENGKVVHARGYGVRELGKPEKVDADTLMMIGSVSKSFTTLLLATAVDDKKIGWKTKAVEALPSFALADAERAKSLAVEDLVCACAGLPRKDMPLLFEFAKKQPDDVLKELSLMTPSTGLRETFQYQNHMVAAGGYLAGHVLYPKLALGAAYDKAMSERIFGPLGMKRTTLDLDRAKKDKNHATPHSRELTGAHKPLSYELERFATYVRPSGSIWSSANEMALYMLNELARGAGKKKRIASEENLTYRWQQQVAISTDVYYGLGFIVAKQKGLRIVSHGGGTFGFGTALMFLPDKGVGVVMISNGSGGHAIESAAKNKLLELWFGSDEKSQAGFDVGFDAEQKLLTRLREESKPVEDAWIAPFLGKHEHAELGAITIEKSKDAFMVNAGEWQTRFIRHVRPDGVTSLLFTDSPMAGFELDVKDESTGSLELVVGQQRYSFTKTR